MPALLDEIAKECSIGCESTENYAPLATSCDSEFFKKIINGLGNTVNNLEKENDELNQKFKDIETKLNQTVQDSKQNEEKLNSVIVIKDTIIINNKALIKELENKIHNLDASKV